MPESVRVQDLMLLVMLAELISLGTGLRGGSSFEIRGPVDDPLCVTFPDARLEESEAFRSPVRVFLALVFPLALLPTVSIRMVWIFGLGTEATSIFSVKLSLRWHVEVGATVIGRVRTEVSR